MKNITQIIKYTLVAAITVMSVSFTVVSAYGLDSDWSYDFGDSSYGYDDGSYGYDDDWYYGSDNSYGYDDDWYYGSDNSYGYDDDWTYDYGSSSNGNDCYGNDCYGYYYEPVYGYDSGYGYQGDYGYTGYSNYGGGYTSYYGGGYGGGCTNCGGSDPYDDLEVECRASDYNIEEGDNVTFRAIVDGGNSPYDYEWDGDVDGDTRTITERFNHEGDYEATVTVTDDDGNRESDTCYIEVEEEEEDYNDLEVECRATDYQIEEGDSVTFRAVVDGGDSPYDYEWDGDADGDTRTITERFNHEGDYEVTITVRDDDGNRESDTCYIEVEEEEDEDDFDVKCEVDDSTVEEGDRVRFTVDVDGGNSPYDYDWSDDVDGNSKTIYERFNREGRYTAKITVTDDDGNRESDTCSVRVEEDDDDRDSNITVTSTTGLSNPNIGTPAVSSVYLSQVPYTGPGDVLAIMLWSIAGILLSMILVSRFRKQSYRKQVQSRIEKFKEENKQTA